MSKNANQTNSEGNDERLVTSNGNEENDDQKQMLEKDEEKTDKNDNAPAEEMNGSTVEIVQPADLEPKHLGFTRTLLLAMFAAMIGTGAQYGYALGVMNAPSEVRRGSKTKISRRTSFFR